MDKKIQTKILNYRVIIERETYPDGAPVYTAFVPTLGITDYGPTIDKVLKSLKDGIELAIECLAKEGKEIPSEGRNHSSGISEKSLISQQGNPYTVRLFYFQRTLFQTTNTF